MRKNYSVLQIAIGLIFLVLMIAGFVGCAGMLSEINIFSDKEEIQLGERFSKEIEKELKLYQDPVIAAYIVNLGQLLAKHSKRRGITYYFKVVDTDVVNAFALPGGYLYVNLGLIRAAENESELAGVIGHEIGHIVGKHGAEQLTKQIGFATVVQLVLGQDPDQTEQVIADIIATGALMKYSRDAENEADGHAVQEMYDAGLNPEGMATFFEKLRKLQKTQPTQLEQIFSTHPPTDERIANVRSQIARLRNKSGLRKDSRRFHDIKKRLPPARKK